MANRHLSRSIVLQTLFEWDSAGYAINDDALNGRLMANTQEFGAREADMPFMQALVRTILAKRPELDRVIEKAAPDWPISKIAVIDRNILRLGLAELLFADRSQVPAKVAINEAIELAKTFGSESSGRFVNGVLGAVYVELGEPGKNDIAKKPKIPREQMFVEELIGAVVYARDSGSIYLALVHDIFGHWTLSKGKLKPDEPAEDGVRRKVKEEMGIDLSVIDEKLGENEYIANDPERGKKRRHCTYYLAEAPFDELTLKREGGLDDAQWFPLAKVGDLNFYDDILPVVTRAINVLVSKERSRLESK
jgi:N utilization substance protein B